MATTTNEGCPIRLRSPFTSRPTAIKSFSSSFFEISPIFEKSHQPLQSRSMDCGSGCPEVQHKILRAKVTIYTALQHSTRFRADAAQLSSRQPGHPEPL